MITKAKPFLKWAGGKGQLLAQFDTFYPNLIRNGQIRHYVEPFLGGGAVFFELAQRFSIQSAYLSDINPDLILTYKVVQQKSTQLLEILFNIQKKYNQTPAEQRNDLYLEIRSDFNAGLSTINYRNLDDLAILRAAQLIFLNKTCFNGLFRVNSKGGFNVPFGKYANPNICDAQNIHATSKILQKAELVNATYEKCFEHVTADSFVYFDPPYRPLNKTSSFTAYTGADFSDADQQKLATFFHELSQKKGAKLMLSNADPKNEDENDDFFEQLFSNYHIHRVFANRAINSVGKKRGAISEILITNYEYEPQLLAFNF